MPTDDITTEFDADGFRIGAFDADGHTLPRYAYVPGVDSAPVDGDAAYISVHNEAR